MSIAEIGGKEISRFLALDEDDGASFSNLLELFRKYSSLGRLEHFKEILVHIRVGTTNSTSSHKHVIVRHLLGKILNLGRESCRKEKSLPFAL